MPLSPDEGKRLIDVIQSMTANGAPREVVARSPEGNRLVRHGSNGHAPIPPVTATAAPSDDFAAEARTLSGKLDANDIEKLYQMFIRRMLIELPDNPIFVTLLANVPEIEVLKEKRLVQLTTDSLRGRLALLAARGFFAEAQTSGQARAELKRTGTDPGGSNMATTLDGLVKDGILTRQGDGFVIAPNVKVTEKTVEA